MAGRPHRAGTLGEVLATRRRRCFVGREAELELVRAALEATEPLFSVLWFTGPGGIGKSSLLEMVAEHAEGSGASVAAGLITRTFPSDSTGVPFYVESATYESKEALIIVEAIGRDEGKLADERVWVLSASGDVLLSGTR